MKKTEKKTHNTFRVILIWMLCIILVLALLFFIGIPIVFRSVQKGELEDVEKAYSELEDKYDEVSFDESSGILYINNEIIVMASENADYDDIEGIADDFDAEIIDFMEDIGFYCFAFEDNMDLEDIENVIGELTSEYYIDDAYVNPLSKECADTADDVTPVYPDDSWNGDGWNVDMPGGNNWGVEAVKAPYAWSYLDELETVNVGLIDAVPNTSHYDLDIEAYISGVDPDSNYYATERIETDAESSNNHGNHVAGTIGARWNNGQGVSGVMGDKANMFYADTITLGEETVDYSSVYDYMKSIKILLNNDVRVINISQYTDRLIGFAASKGNQEAINYLSAMENIAEAMLGRMIDSIEENDGNDFVICLSAGNSNNTTYYKDNGATYGYTVDIGWNPFKLFGGESGGSLAKYNHFLSLIDDEDVRERIIVVGSVGIDENESTENEVRYRYSDFSNVGDRVDIVAPGENIWSLSVDDCYSATGTSMAAPHVSGAAGLAFAANPELTGPEVKNIVLASVNGRYFYQDGNRGMLDVQQVVEKAIETRATTVGRVISSNRVVGIDLCFLVDTTASMGDDIQNAKDNMVDILDQLEEQSSDYRVALIDYRDFASRAGSEDYPARVQLDFSDDDEEIREAINKLDLGSGGDYRETVYSGFDVALGLDWRVMSKKVIIVLGDAPPLDPEPYTEYTYDSTLLALYNADIGIDLENSDYRVLGEPEDSMMSVYTIGIGSDSAETFSKIAEDTGGKYTEIETAEEVSGAIVDSIKMIEVAPSVVTTDYGEEFSGETVELYKDDEFLFSYVLDETGSFELDAMELGEYEWKIRRLNRQGTITFDEDDDKAEIEKEDASWYNFVFVIWYRHRIALFAITIGIIVAIILICIIVKKIKVWLKKMKLIIKQEKKNDSTTSNCPKCSAVVTAGYAFCENCGFRLSTTSLVTTVNKCPKCNMAVSDEHIFCTGCGFNLKNMIENIESNDKKVCDKCKTVADEADIFCTSCGNRL